MTMEARFREGVEAFERGRMDWAIEAMQDVVAEQPHRAEAHLYLSQSYMAAEQYGEAIEAVDRALHLDPQNDLAHAVAATLLAKFGDARAKQFFDSALALNASRGLTYYWLARYYLENEGRREEAKQSLNTSLQLDPLNAEAHLMLARLYEADGNVKLAEHAYREATQMGPNLFDAWNAAGHHWLYRRNDPRQAFPFFRRAVQIAPNDNDAMRNFLLCFQARNKWKYRLFNLHFFIGAAGRWRWFLILGLWLMIQVLQIVATAYPRSMPWISPLVLTYVGFCIYTWTITPLFKFLVRRGWIS